MNKKLTEIKCLLPEIGSHIIQRPGNVPKSHYIPNNETAFWDEFYSIFTEYFHLVQPIENLPTLVNPYFGRFGNRWHPVSGEAHYFHIGLDTHTEIGTPISSVADGLFEYSGYVSRNGNYTVLSHPHIATRDGFILNSIYMHCDTNAHMFNLMQKIVRKYISKSPQWVNKSIAKGETIAYVGNTGIEGGYLPHLHLQLDFVSSDGIKRVSVNPLRLFGFEAKANLTSDIKDVHEFRLFYQNNIKSLSPWAKYIESYL